jgi:cell wall-associated NlpC family hydrolase
VRETAKMSMCTLMATAAVVCVTAVSAEAASASTGGGVSATPTKKTTAADDPATTSSGGGIAAGDKTVMKQVAAIGHPMVAGTRAKYIHNVAYAPSQAPDSVKQAIWAANKIIGRPYVYGGGHASFTSKGYDCSGTVSYALHGGGLLSSPMASGDFFNWGKSGRGKWITLYTNSGHMYAVIAGIRLDTSSADDPRGLDGPRWRPVRGSNAGFKIRHPRGL